MENRVKILIADGNDEFCSHLKKLLEELEEPLDRFDEKLFTEIVQAISISRRDEMTVTLIGGLRFTEML